MMCHLINYSHSYPTGPRTHTINRRTCLFEIFSPFVPLRGKPIFHVISSFKLVPFLPLHVPLYFTSIEKYYFKWEYDLLRFSETISLPSHLFLLKWNDPSLPPLHYSTTSFLEALPSKGIDKSLTSLGHKKKVSVVANWPAHSGSWRHEKQIYTIDRYLLLKKTSEIFSEFLIHTLLQKAGSKCKKYESDTFEVVKYVL